MPRTLILHDLRQNDAERLLPQDPACSVFAAVPAVRHCTGCFGCWIKTPGICVINDRAVEFGALMPKHERITVISRMVFGGLSPDVKAVLDRNIGFILPFFAVRDGEMRHPGRYGTSPDMRYIFYGPDMNERERETARRLVEANAKNFSAKSHDVRFCPALDDVKEALA